MKTLSIKVPRVVSAKVVRLARRQRTTVSAVVRDAIEAYGEAPLDGSFAARAKKYLGVFEGPGDLTTHLKHMAGYGTWKR